MSGVGGADPLGTEALADECPRDLATVARAGPSLEPVDLSEVILAEAEVQKA